MTNGKSFQTPHTKRFVERFASRINRELSTSITNAVLHTVGERETLVRTIIALDVASKTGGTAGTYSLAISREPQGTALITPGLSENLDNAQVREEIWSYHGNLPAVEMLNKIEVDLKSMRKLDPGDELVLRVLAENASSIDLDGTITQFFKQT